MLEALLATIIRPCLGQGSNKSTPLPKDEANELFGTLRAEEILAINTAFREQLRVSVFVFVCLSKNVKSAQVVRFFLHVRRKA